MADYFNSIGCERDELCSQRALWAYEYALEITNGLLSVDRISMDPVLYLKISTYFARFMLRKYRDLNKSDIDLNKSDKDLNKSYTILVRAIEHAKDVLVNERSEKLFEAIQEANYQIEALDYIPEYPAPPASIPAHVVSH